MLKTTGLDPRRLSDTELFLENKRALAPLTPSNTPLKLYPLSERFISPREQVSVASILNETEDYINVDGVLWSSITLKSPPDATYPGILREIVTAGIPVVVSTQVMVPNQAKVLDAYKKKQKKMAAAQLDQNRQRPGRCHGAGCRARTSADPARDHFEHAQNLQGQPDDRGSHFSPGAYPSTV